MFEEGRHKHGISSTSHDQNVNTIEYFDYKIKKVCHTMHSIYKNITLCGYKRKKTVSRQLILSLKLKFVKSYDKKFLYT